MIPPPELIHRHVTPHAKMRTLQRYGVQPTDEQWRDAWLAITSAVMGHGREAMLRYRERDGQERWIVRVAGVAVNVVYRPDLAVIVSVMPPVDHARRRHR